jgi:hypothetical protein
MKNFAKSANRPRRRRGVSQSGIRRIEKLVALGDRAVRRHFISAQRPASSPDHHSITIQDGGIMLNDSISLGRATSNTITGHTTPAEAVANIQSGKWAKQIAALRSATGDERDRLKKTLPAFLWTGQFTARKNDGIEKFSGLICADVDKITERVGELHDIARQDPHVAAAFVSPSGMGIKIVFRVPVAADAKEHYRNFVAVRSHVALIYAAKVDEAAKDVARLCFVSHDPAAFFNADAVPLDVPSEPATVASVQTLAAPVAIQPSTRTEIAERILGEIEWTDEITGFCKCPGEHLHTTPTAADHCRIKLDAATTLHCFHGSCAGIRDGVNHELRSQIGKAERSTATVGVAAEYLGDDVEQPQPSLIERLAARVYSPHVKPPEPTPRFFLNGVQICTPGNVTTFFAQPKAGKTAALNAVIASTFATREADCFGFTSENPHGHAVLHFDTEQCQFDHWQGVGRLIRRAKVDAAPPWLLSYWLKGFTVAEIREAIALLLDDAKHKFGGIHSGIIDGVADAVNDVNDPSECNPFVARLEKYAVEYDCPILNVIHLNPGSTFKTRGHLGAQLERKSETNLQLEKDENEVTVIWSPNKNRHAPIPKSTAPRFAWSDQHQMHVSVQNINGAKVDKEREELTELSRTIFSATPAMRRFELETAVKIKLAVKDKTAERRVTTMLALEIVKKDLAGFYVLTA